MAEFRIEGKPVTGPYIRTALAQAYYKGWAVEWTGTYEEYLQTNEWREYRERILRRDGHRCRLCANNEHLIVHHSSYVFLGAERDQDVLTLCESCHYDFHRWRKRPKLIGEILQDQLAHDKNCRQATEGQRALRERESRSEQGRDPATASAEQSAVVPHSRSQSAQKAAA